MDVLKKVIVVSGKVMKSSKKICEKSAAVVVEILRSWFKKQVGQREEERGRGRVQKK